MSVPLYTEAQQSQVRRVIPDLIAARELLLELTFKDLRVRYRYAAMGFLWALLEPLMMSLILTFVFTVFTRGQAREPGSVHFAVQILCGYVPWQFVSSAIAAATRSLTENDNLVKKVYFPREVIPLSAVGNATVNFAIGFLLLLVTHLILGGRLGLNLAWFPVLFAIQLALVSGIGLLLSSANVFFRDIRHLTDIALFVGFYATPIFYTVTMARTAFEHHPWVMVIYLLNPMAGLVASYREAILYNTAPAFGLLWWPVVFSALALLLGVVAFRRMAPHFSDNL